jgi:hypothetical protein
MLLVDVDADCSTQQEENAVEYTAVNNGKACRKNHNTRFCRG